jgi:hypothetical protein
MDQQQLIAQLARHQEASLAVLADGVEAIETGQAAVLARSAELRARLAEALGGYQHFKHAHIFDPAIASDDPERVALARRMKVECIGAGEVFRQHMSRWSRESIETDWANYRPVARLTANQLRRHIMAERDGILQLIRAYA